MLTMVAFLVGWNQMIVVAIQEGQLGAVGQSMRGNILVSPRIVNPALACDIAIGK
jgi:hypothetical protein